MFRNGTPSRNNFPLSFLRQPHHRHSRQFDKPEFGFYYAVPACSPVRKIGKKQ